MEPNLTRIPANGDAAAVEIIGLARSGITPDLQGQMVDRDFIALGRYGVRHATTALREQSAGRLRDALLAMAISETGLQSDPRDTMIAMSLHHFVARQLGLVPAELFDDVASCLLAGPVPDLLREFGGRHDITLKAFGWLLVQTVDGPDFMPAPYPWARTAENAR